VAIGESERQRDQAHHQAGGGDGEHLVHADTGDPALLGRGRNVARELAQLAERELARSAAGRNARPLGRQEAVAQHDAQRLVPAGLVAFRWKSKLWRCVGKLQHDALAGVLDQKPAAAGDDDLLALAGHGVGEKHPFPVLPPAGGFEDIEDLALPLVVEDARLHLLRDRAGQNVEVEPGDGAVALRQEVDHQQAVDHGQHGREQQDGAQQAVDAGAGRAQGDELAVGRQAADADRTQQEGHRDGQNDDIGQRIEHQLADDRSRQAAPDDHLGRAEEELEQQNERVN
jgi:hypothetical protein